MFPRTVIDGSFFRSPIELRQGGEWTQPLAFICKIMVKSDASPPRLSPVDILAQVMLGLIWTAFDDAFVRSSKAAFRAVEGLRVRLASLPARPSRMHDRIDVQAQCRLPPRSMNKVTASAAVAAIARLVELSSRYAWLVILGFLLVAIASASYFTSHFAITTDSNKLLSTHCRGVSRNARSTVPFPGELIRSSPYPLTAATPEAAVGSSRHALTNSRATRT